MATRQLRSGLGSLPRILAGGNGPAASPKLCLASASCLRFQVTTILSAARRVFWVNAVRLSASTPRAARTTAAWAVRLPRRAFVLTDMADPPPLSRKRQTLPLLRRQQGRQRPQP